MASEIRVNQIQNRSGLSTVTFSDVGVSIAGITTVGILSATGNAVLSGNLTVTGSISGSGGGSVTSNVTGNLTGNVNATGLSTFSGGIQVGATTSIVVGNTFLKATSIGIGTTNTTGRNAGVSTAQGTLIFNSDTGSVQVYNGTAWSDVGKEAMRATGGYTNEYTDSTTGRIYRAHIFTNSGFFTVQSAPPSATVDYLVVAGGEIGRAHV